LRRHEKQHRKGIDASRWLIGAVLTAVSVTVNAQTYDLDITMTGIAATPVTFSGSLSFNAKGTGCCSAAFCGPGITPDFAEVWHLDEPRPEQHLLRDGR
jgi:hypothetical protein